MVYSPSILELLISNHAYNIMRVICMLVSSLRICSMLLQDSFKKKKYHGTDRTYLYTSPILYAPVRISVLMSQWNICEDEWSLK